MAEGGGHETPPKGKTPCPVGCTRAAARAEGRGKVHRPPAIRSIWDLGMCLFQDSTDLACRLLSSYVPAYYADRRRPHRVGGCCSFNTDLFRTRRRHPPTRPTRHASACPSTRRPTAARVHTPDRSCCNSRQRTRHSRPGSPLLDLERLLDVTTSASRPRWQKLQGEVTHPDLIRGLHLTVGILHSGELLAR